MRRLPHHENVDRGKRGDLLGDAAHQRALQAAEAAAADDHEVGSVAPGGIDDRLACLPADDLGLGLDLPPLDGAVPGGVEQALADQLPLALG